MRILAVESSAISVSAAILEDGRLLAEYFINNKLTHSQTLASLIQQALQTADIPLNTIDLFAAAVGPGSFTGIRIGVAAVKGLAFGEDKPCVSVSTLEAMALNLISHNGIICCTMDARCNQVYNALFRANEGSITRLCEDRAVKIDALYQELKGCNSEQICLIGDGAHLCVAPFESLNPRIAPENLLYQRAYGVAKAAERIHAEGGAISAAELNPVYLRPSQAERELSAKK
ncbi:MAG: tRNA (adenosine(37)-N6)-threonylcarbamoyltransferase complex dimerization subunit type 1 TsaB [Oscillospiraceae bacterium]|jgi:tRNA threonylcarbamoyladenosine biosynthesis protein TsaB|nr:tRNA (adenosine(37)-N6)-threonylcarbamoyltransferase complex dimerization subunit type 1 TsaB [Oscillospiraceae bacterium]